MNLMLAVFFGAGVAAVVYTKMGRRLGYSNQQNVALVVGVCFVLSTIIFYSVLTLFLKSH